MTNYELTEIYRNRLNLAPKAAVREVRAEFFAYKNADSRIRLREGVLIVRVADFFRDAPHFFHAALADILIGKVFKRRVSPDAQNVYKKYLSSNAVLNKLDEWKRSEKRAIKENSRGASYDLLEIFERVNQTYFRGEVEKPTLAWSARKNYRKLAHYDAARHAIVFSRILDDARVPDYVVDFVMFHEILHIVFPVTINDGRRAMHTPQFRAAERKFVYFQRAELWLDKFSEAVFKESSRLKKRRID